MEDKKVSKELLARYLNQQCTPQEAERVRCYLDTEISEPELKQLIEADAQVQMQIPSTIDPTISDRVFSKVMGKIHAKPVETPFFGWAGIFRRSSWRVAASVGVLLVFAALLYQLNWVSDTITIHTAYGEQDTLILPDQSVVVLNGNSQLRYSKPWSPGAREVWLSGEAFFKVTHTHDHRQFIVHTSNGLRVEVLGTEFNVFDRKRGKQVVLNSGKVRLSLERDGREDTLVMKPGDLVGILPQSGFYIRRRVDPLRYSAWQRRVIQMDNTSLGEILAILEDTYGVQARVSEARLLKLTASGTMPAKNKEVLLKVIGETFNLTLAREKNQITFRSKVSNQAP